jgi:hypothetical protein
VSHCTKKPAASTAPGKVIAFDRAAS